MGQFTFLVVDLTILAITVVSGLLAATRGFVKEVLAVAAWISGAAAAVLLFPFLMEFTRGFVSREILADGITIGVIFVDQPDWLLDAKLLPIVDQAGQWLLELVPAAFRDDGFFGFVEPAIGTLTPGRLG